MKLYKIRLFVDGKVKVFSCMDDAFMVGVNSAVTPFGVQWIFLDIDNMSKKGVQELAQHIMLNENLRRVIVVKSTNKHRGWHILSFSPKPYLDVIRILSDNHTDGGHLAKTQDNGFSTLRVTPKDGYTPRVKYVINSNIIDRQLNFYDYDAEKAYRKLLGEKIG